MLIHIVPIHPYFIATSAVFYSMSGLSSYRDKRDLSQTPELRPRQVAPDQKRDPRLVFVIQKHRTSHLHYDFRLEVRGVLKSWAIPKGPSLNPSDQRLAIETKDHPFNHTNHEGEPPSDNVGPSDVAVWDQGWYEPVGPGAGPSDRMVRGLRRGAIRLVLYGKKLKGGFSFIRSHAPEQWLLTKRDDIHAQHITPKLPDADP